MVRHIALVSSVLLLLVVMTGCRQEPPAEWSYRKVYNPTPSLSNSQSIELDKELLLAIHEVLDQETGSVHQPKLLGHEYGKDGEADALFHKHLLHGKAVYDKRCVQCHGVTGDGDGPQAEYLDPLPRDYRRGIFKFTSTPIGSKPRRSDLIRTLKHGVPGTAMPAFDRLLDRDMKSLVDYLYVLIHRGELEVSLFIIADEEEELDQEYVQEVIQEEILAAWKESEDSLVMPETKMPKYSPETIELGRQAFIRRGCAKCHGFDGRSKVESYDPVEVAKALNEGKRDPRRLDVGNDTWGHPTYAADLTSGMFRGGDRPLDIYRRIHSGINGTPMPAFAESMAEELDTLWHLVHFLRSDLVGNRRRANLAPKSFATDAEIAAIVAAETGGDTSGEEETATEEASAADDEETATEEASDEEADDDNATAESAEIESTETDTSDEKKNNDEKAAENKT